MEPCPRIETEGVIARKLWSDTKKAMLLLVGVFQVLLGVALLWHRERLARYMAGVQHDQSRASPWFYPGIVGRLYTSERAWRNFFVPVLALASVAFGLMWLWGACTGLPTELPSRRTTSVNAQGTLSADRGGVVDDFRRAHRAVSRRWSHQADPTLTTRTLVVSPQTSAGARALDGWPFAST